MAAMVDLHVHLLPGIDDGPQSIEESIELARALVEGGVQTAAATPHVRPDHPAVVPGELAGRCQELRDALAAAAVPLEVVTAGEVELVWALGASDEELRLVTYGQAGAWVLVETPYTLLPRHFEEILFELQVRIPGILLAHPERNPTFQEDPRRLDALVERGIRLQVTASSLVKGGSGSARMARDLVKNRRADVIASDAHGVRHVVRAPLVVGAEAAARLAPERAGWMVNDAPRAILEGQTLRAPEPLGRGRLARALGLR